MNRTKALIIDTFWQLLEEKPYNKITVQDIVDRCQVNRNTFYYHFQDIPTLTATSVQGWMEDTIKTHGDFDSPSTCLIYMVKECTKRKKAFLHLYCSAQKDEFSLYLNKTGYHIFRTYVENMTEHIDTPEKDKETLIRYYKCTFIGILMDWLDCEASYDLVEFCEDLCELFSGSEKRAFLKHVNSSDRHS